MANTKAATVTEDKDEMIHAGGVNGSATQDDLADEQFDDSGFEETDQIGFPPYWNPKVGKKFKARVIALDQRDPAFFRWVLQPSHDIVCATGPADDAAPIKVKKGDFFTMSVYAACPLERYIGLEIIVECTEARPMKGPKNDMWVFKVRFTSETKQVLEDRKTAKMEKLRAENPDMAGIPDLENVYEMSIAAKKLAEDNLKSSKSMPALSKRV